MTGETLKYDKEINFNRVISENEADSIETFMTKTEADLLAVYFEEHGFLYRMFHESLIKKLTSYANFPVLILHK